LLAFIFHFFMFVGPRRSALEAGIFVPKHITKLDPSALVVLEYSKVTSVTCVVFFVM
jgi:hypothetical protein